MNCPMSFYLGLDKILKMCQLGPTTGGKASTGATGKVEAHGCGRLSRTSVITLHQPNGSALCCRPASAGWWWGIHWSVDTWKSGGLRIFSLIEYLKCLLLFKVLKNTDGKRKKKIHCDAIYCKLSMEQSLHIINWHSLIIVLVWAASDIWFCQTRWNHHMFSSETSDKFWRLTCIEVLWT